MCRIYTLQLTKRGLSAYDDKRYVLGDNSHTLAFGHHAIPPLEIVVEEVVDEVPQVEPVAAHDVVGDAEEEEAAEEAAEEDEPEPAVERIAPRVSIDRPQPPPATHAHDPFVRAPTPPPPPIAWEGRVPPDDAVGRVLFAAQLCASIANAPPPPAGVDATNFRIAYTRARRLHLAGDDEAAIRADIERTLNADQMADINAMIDQLS